MLNTLREDYLNYYFKLLVQLKSHQVFTLLRLYKYIHMLYTFKILQKCTLQRFRLLS